MTVPKHPYAIRKYDGEGPLDWAVFNTVDLKGKGRRSIEPGEAEPLVRGLSQRDARAKRDEFNQQHHAAMRARYAA